jgi:hypothetical protein
MAQNEDLDLGVRILLMADRMGLNNAVYTFVKQVCQTFCKENEVTVGTEEDPALCLGLGRIMSYSTRRPSLDEAATKVVKIQAQLPISLPALSAGASVSATPHAVIGRSGRGDCAAQRMLA